MKHANHHINPVIITFFHFFYSRFNLQLNVVSVTSCSIYFVRVELKYLLFIKYDRAALTDIRYVKLYCSDT